MSNENYPNQPKKVDTGNFLKDPAELRLFNLFNSNLPHLVDIKQTSVNYDDLFNSDPDVQKQLYVDGQQYLQNMQIERQEVYGGSLQLKVSKKSEAFSKQHLENAMKRDSRMANMLVGYSQSYKISPDHLTQALREDPKLRFEVGMWLLQKINFLSDHLPPRLQTNTEKANRIGVKGYYNSREVCARMALDMLSGLFDIDKQDEITYDPINNPDGVGQHRWAAQYILNHNIY